jgi:hypothetical protein
VRKRGPRWPEMAQDRPQRAAKVKNISRWPPEGPKTAQECPRWPQEGPKKGPRWPKIAPRMPKTAARERQKRQEEGQSAKKKGKNRNFHFTPVFICFASPERPQDSSEKRQE